MLAARCSRTDRHVGLSQVPQEGSWPLLGSRGQLPDPTQAAAGNRSLAVACSPSYRVTCLCIQSKAGRKWLSKVLTCIPARLSSTQELLTHDNPKSGHT